MENIKLQVNGDNNLVENDLQFNAVQEVAQDEIVEQSSFQYPAIFCSKTLLELCSSSWSRSPKAAKDIQPYLRGCKWSPDGTCCLSVVNNDGVHVTELPRDLYDGDVTTKRTIDILDSVIHVKEAGLVYDYCWYPSMTSNCPETCFWITTRQNAPIQMWDAFDGSLKCSYRGFNSVDEMEPALSCTFSSDCTRIIAGYKKCVRTFDIDRPGRDFAEHKIASPASCLATHSNLLAVGSWNTTISLYNVNERGGYKSIGKMYGHGGGLTHMKFTPNGRLLVSGARKDNRLLVWDIRYYRRPLNILSRVVDTNQRIYFDISPCGKYLVSGGTDGILRVWDVDKVNWVSEIDIINEEVDDSVYKFPLHKDCCNSVSIHPFRPIIATGSGQYHFEDPLKLLNEVTPKLETDYTDMQSTIDTSCEQMDISMNGNSILNDTSLCDELKYSSHSENSLVFWWTGGVKDLNDS